MLRLVLSILMWAGLSVGALAQSTPPTDYEQIIRDIITGAPQQGRTITDGQLSTMTVTLDFEDSRPLSDHMMVVSAVNDNDAIVGQSSVRLDGLSSPLSMTVPLPRGLINSAITLRARIDDPARNTVAKSISDGFFTGGPVALSLSPSGSLPQIQSRVSEFETVDGTVRLAAPETIFNGAKLTVQLVEDALAGGNSSPVKGEIDVIITDPTRPVPFSLRYAVPEGGFIGALGLKAVVKDWAGRTTHVMPNRVAFDGPQKSYSLTLDSLRQGAEVSPFTIDTPTRGSPDTPADIVVATPAPTPPPDQIVTLISSATFPALRGLPRGATLNVTLWTPDNAGRQNIINRSTVLLDGLSGDVDFAFPDVSVPGGAPLFYDGTITTAEGLVLFRADRQPTGAGFSLLRLSPTAAY